MKPLLSLLGSLLLLLTGCAGRPGAYWPPGSAARPGAVVAPPLPRPPAAPPAAIAAGLPPPATTRPVPSRPFATAARLSSAPPVVARAVGRRLARQIRAATAPTAARAPASHAADGLAYLFWAALILLGLLVAVALLIWLLPPISLGVVGAWILFGLLAAGALYAGYALFE